MWYRVNEMSFMKMNNAPMAPSVDCLVVDRATIFMPN